MASSSLMLIHIGPVQDFIASARRCQDLWFGSYLLSELARAVAGALDGEAQALVFPGSMDDQHNVANKIMARVPAGSERERACSA